MKSAGVATNDGGVDPRVRRTRGALFTALGGLLATHEFEKISVLDIAEAACLNRATFYAHFPDKFALFEAMVAQKFEELLGERHVPHDCDGALRAVMLTVCDYLVATPRSDCERRQMDPHLGSAVIAVVRRIILGGLEYTMDPLPVSREMIATTTSWAIYGAAKEWLHMPNRCPAHVVVDAMAALISPLMHPNLPAERTEHFALP